MSNDSLKDRLHNCHHAVFDEGRYSSRRSMNSGLLPGSVLESLLFVNVDGLVSEFASAVNIGGVRRAVKDCQSVQPEKDLLQK